MFTMFRVGLPRNILRCARISRHIPFHSLPPHLLLESFKLLVKTIQQLKRPKDSDTEDHRNLMQIFLSFTSQANQKIYIEACRQCMANIVLDDLRLLRSG